MFFPVSSMHATIRAQALIRGRSILADWQRTLDGALLAIGLVLMGAGFYWLVGA